jgi:hypothetical protein
VALVSKTATLQFVCGVGDDNVPVWGSCPFDLRQAAMEEVWRARMCIWCFSNLKIKKKHVYLVKEKSLLDFF